MKTHINKLFGSLAFAAVLSLSSAAQAIEIVDPWDPENVTINYVGSPDTSGSPGSLGWYTFTHDITDGVDGFVVGVDTLASATLSILLRDDVEKGNEVFRFVFGPLDTPTQIVNYTEINVANGATGQTYLLDLTLSSLADLRADGKISVTIQSLIGVSPSKNDLTGFIFDKSTLTAQVPRGAVGASAVPEPASLALLGIGLVGLAAMRRRKTA